MATTKNRDILLVGSMRLASAEDVFRTYAYRQAERYNGRARLRPGVSPSAPRFDNLGYADWAQESYVIFKRLQIAALYGVPAAPVLWYDER